MEVETLIARWTAREGGAERANYQMYLSEICDAIGVARPDPSGSDHALNDYAFERAVKSREGDPVASTRRIDLYKKGCFILEAKQSRLPGAKNALPDQLALPEIAPERLGRRGSGRNWDAMMSRARSQALDYVGRLDADHPAPPFLITCDVGHAFEIFADFSGNGRSYQQFGGRKGFRVHLEDLRRPEIRQMLAAIWTDPYSLDPTRQSARVTTQIARRLAAVTRSLEAHYPPEEVALFVMRCIFCMFAEDVDLLPKGEFTRLLEECARTPRSLVPLLEELWAKMDADQSENRYFAYFHAHLRHFNGNLYRDARALPLERAEIGELVAAARHEWTKVDPAIFGTLLEQALDPRERRKLGAHYTPRAYVEQLVEVTVMEPLREDWRKALTRAEAAKDEEDERRAVALVRDFHHSLCTIRVLDPACGTGNFLYVSLEMAKQLEGEVLETLADLGDNEMLGLEAETVGPHQFLGLELNPRAAAIAELVVWIGYLQQHYKTHTGHPGEPILKAFTNINFGRKDGYDAVLAADGEGFSHPRRPMWPDAEFIVGNPPFIGGKDLRSRLGSGYAEALWSAHPHMNESADFVMYWWDRAAGLLTRTGGPLRRFGLVTTNSISQVFQRRVIERHLTAKKPISLIHAVADHPWTKATKDSAAVRIAMTVGEAGRRDGVMLETVREDDLGSDEPRIELAAIKGIINSDLTVGVDLTRVGKLLANASIAHDGVKLHGAGFIVTPSQAALLGLGEISGLETHLRPYRNGRDLTSKSRNLMVIDLFGLTSQEARDRFPRVYQHILETVKPIRDTNSRESYRSSWWIFGEPRRELRPALDELDRFIATVDTARHRIFQFVPSSFILDDKSVIIAEADASILAITSSRIHLTWALRAGGWLGQGNDAVYTKSRCFDPFPFPELSLSQRQDLRAAGEELDVLRKRVLDDHPDLTLTGLYNVLDKLRTGAALTDKDQSVKERGLVLIIKELHDTIDRLTADAYGWPADLPEDRILERLVALNAERAREESRGYVRWLRPDYQIPRFAKGAKSRTGDLELVVETVAADAGKPLFPKDRYEQPLAVEAMLAANGAPTTAAAIASGFRRGGRRIEPRVAQVLVTLARYGRATALEDGRFAAGRASAQDLLRRAA